MGNWVESELVAQDMGDVRLNKRMVKLTENLCRDPSLSIPCANTSWAETLAAYRFFDNDKVTFASIMSGHKASTLSRIQTVYILVLYHPSNQKSIGDHQHLALCSYQYVLRLPLLSLGLAEMLDLPYC